MIDGYEIVGIGYNVFFEKNIQGTVTLPNNLIWIDNNAFEKNSITDIVFPFTLEFIGQWAFYTNNLTGTIRVTKCFDNP